MNFYQLLTFLELKDMVKDRQGLMYDKLDDSGMSHVVKQITVSDGHLVAKVIYRCKQLPHNHQDCNYAFVYATILHKGYASHPDTVFIENASLKDLKRWFAGYDEY